MKEYREMKDFITTLLMGLFAGILIGLWIGHREIPQSYEREICRLQSWNDQLIRMSQPVAEVRIPDKMYPQKVKPQVGK